MASKAQIEANSGASSTALDEKSVRVEIVKSNLNPNQLLENHEIESQIDATLACA